MTARDVDFAGARLSKGARSRSLPRRRRVFSSALRSTSSTDGVSSTKELISRSIWFVIALPPRDRHSLHCRSVRAVPRPACGRGAGGCAPFLPRSRAPLRSPRARAWPRHVAGAGPRAGLPGGWPAHRRGRSQRQGIEVMVGVRARRGLGAVLRSPRVGAQPALLGAAVHSQEVRGDPEQPRQRRSRRGSNLCRARNARANVSAARSSASAAPTRRRR